MGLEPELVADYSEAGPPGVYTGPGWNLAQRLAFRFVLVYFVLYILPFPIPNAVSLIAGVHDLVTGHEPNPVPDAEQPFVIKNVVEPVNKYVIKPYEDFWDEAVLWTGAKVFKKDIEYRPAGSGDTTWNYVQVFAFAVLSAIVTLLWTLAAGAWWRWRRRSRLGYPHLHECLRVFVRFYLAATVFNYGSVKVIKLQFAYPGPDTLLHTYGESSPMHLLWTFMGASDGYTWFTGMGEVIAGLLLCTRRTTLLGALVTFGVMGHVVALNFCYDVPVKLFSTHLMLMALFLAAPDLPWLARVFVLGQRAVPRGYTPLVRSPWLDWTLFVIRTALVLTEVGLTFYQNHEASKTYGRQNPEPPLYGLWEVEEFTLDSQVRPPLTTDAGRWQRVAFNKGIQFRKAMPAIPPTMMVRNMPGKVLFFAQVAVNEEERMITLTQRTMPGGPPPAPLGMLRYTELEPDVILAEGDVTFVADGKPGPKHVKVRLRHYGNDRFLLSSRGFHWVNEVPYNQYGPRTDDPPKIMPPPKRP
jgi:hypothetical protein